jgi:membrane protein YqaA with SNARE-associated domain
MTTPPADSSGDPSVKKPKGLMRRLYAWMLSWAETPYGTPALFLLSFAESSFFPIPPDVLQIALSVSKPRRAFFYAAVSAVASVLGGIAGWAIGFGAWEALDGFFYNYVPGVTPERIDYVGKLYEANAFWSILAAAFTPIPFKVFTISAGIFHEYVPLQTLILASVLGRSTRFFLVASGIWYFGPAFNRVLERHFEWVTLALFALLVGGFFAIKWMAH